MAKCNYCGREMLTANGCSYKRVVIKGEHKKTFNRIKVGAPGDWYEKSVGTPEEKDIRCGDCGAKIGYYHHYGCDIEKCPIVRKPSPKSNSVTFLPEFFFKISIISFTASALHPNLKTLWSSWKTLSFPTTDRSLRWLQAVWKLWGFQSRRVISTRMTSPPSMFPSNLSAFITSF